MKSKRFRYGVMATVLTVLVVTALVVVNILMSVLTDRLGLSVDLTASGAFTVSDSIEDALRLVDDEVRITVLYNRTEFIERNYYFAQVATVLDRAEELNPLITVRYISPITEPAVKSEYPQLSVREGNLILHNLATDRAEEIPLNTLFTLAADGATIVSSQAEEVLASRLLAMTADNASGVAFTEGHGEEEYAALTSLLELNNYTVQKVGTLVQSIPDDVRVVIIPAPMSDFTADEIRLLEDFLYNDGAYGTGIVYFASTEQPKLPNLEGFLASYGIVVTDQYVRESDPNKVMVTSTDSAAAVRYLDGEICALAMGTSGYTVSTFTRSLHTAYEQSGNVSVTPVLGFSETAYEYPIIPPEGEVDVRLSGDLYAAVRARISVMQNDVPVSSNVVAFGSSLFVYDGFLTTEGVNNAEVMVGLTSFLAPSEISLQAAPKTLGGTPITLTQGQARSVGTIFMVVIPAMVLVAGITIFIRRRNR